MRAYWWTGARRFEWVKFDKGFLPGLEADRLQKIVNLKPVGAFPFIDRCSRVFPCAGFGGRAYACKFRVRNDYDSINVGHDDVAWHDGHTPASNGSVQEVAGISPGQDVRYEGAGAAAATSIHTRSFTP